MKLEEIYLKDITRAVNPAVSASDLAEETAKIEIDEYVFTDEIVNSLYKILSAIRKRQLSHNGIWINGYFGTGKSHFLKYLDYCLDTRFQEKALGRLEEAVKDLDPFRNPTNNLDVSVSEMHDLVSWIKSAKVDTILFNIGTVNNIRGNEQCVFLDAFWHEFNSFRGYNRSNLALARYFEKVLDEKGKFFEFKQQIKKQLGLNWEQSGADLAITELDTVLKIGKEVVPSLSIDSIKKRIEDDDALVSVESFCEELKQYLQEKDDKYRLIFLVDEISQFIDARRGLLLQLQEIVTRLHEKCNDKIWIAATAQQDLQEILESCQINATSEDYGKIMGRFEVKVSLTGTKSEYITQKRILDKNGAAAIKLGELYDKKRNAIAAQFQLPPSYNAFANKDEFIKFYPFVPYQFRLIEQVFNSFERLDFVDREVKGNERSIIKVTHSTAKKAKDWPVGSFIPFDSFFGPMFKGALVAKGQRAIRNANNVIAEYSDKEMGQRAVNILFMVCNLSQNDKLLFPATVDNITCLLMNDVDTQKLTLKENVQKVLDYLMDRNIIRTEVSKAGMVSYAFYSEDESEVASLIKNQNIDNNTMAEELKELFINYITPQPRETFESSKFTIGASIMEKNFLSNNADITLNFVMESSEDSAEQFAFTNTPKVLAFFMAEEYKNQKELRNKFYWYCQAQTYLRNNRATSEERAKTLQEFKQRAADLYRSKIEKGFRDLFDKSTVISGTTVLEIGTNKGKTRYEMALKKHFQNVFPQASLVADLPVTSTDLNREILQPSKNVQLTPVSEAERRVKDYLLRHQPEVNVNDIVQNFAAAPYGWSEICTLAILNLLVLRNEYMFVYNNNPHVERQVVAQKICKEKQKFTIRTAEKISQELINNFINSWRTIYNKVATFVPEMDPRTIYEEAHSQLAHEESDLDDVYRKVRDYPFGKTVQDLRQLVDTWRQKRDIQEFFKQIIADAALAQQLEDKYKQIVEFCADQFARYQEYLQFIRDNEANFEQLSGCEDAVNAMLALKQNAWPIDDMPSYKKLRDELQTQLEQVKKSLRQQIADAYTHEVEQLHSLAEENQVPYNKTAKDVVADKTKSDNIFVLKNVLNEKSSFYQEELDSILNHGNKNTVKFVKLNTRNSTPITNEKEVDAYLKQLKGQLMEHISKGDKIIIS